MTPTGTGPVQFGEDNAVTQLEKNHMIPMPSLACRGSRTSPLEQEETICSPWRRQLAGVRQHVQACNVGGPCAKKNILAILPPSLWWAGQPQWFPQTGEQGDNQGRVLCLAPLPAQRTHLLLQGSVSLCRAVAIALQLPWGCQTPHKSQGSQPLQPAWYEPGAVVDLWLGRTSFGAPLASAHRWCTQHLGV